MSSSPTWLTTLQRLRDYHRDTALHSLAQRLQTATAIRDATARVEALIAQGTAAQQQLSGTGRLNFDRLLQIRQDRDDLQAQLVELRQLHSVAEAAVNQAQAIAAKKDAEVNVLKRLGDRYDSAHQQARRHQEEQSSLDIAASLCNRGLSG